MFARAVEKLWDFPTRAAEVKNPGLALRLRLQLCQLRYDRLLEDGGQALGHANDLRARRVPPFDCPSGLAALQALYSATMAGLGRVLEGEDAPFEKARVTPPGIHLVVPDSSVTLVTKWLSQHAKDAQYRSVAGEALQDACALSDPTLGLRRLAKLRTKWARQDYLEDREFHTLAYAVFVSLARIEPLSQKQLLYIIKEKHEDTSEHSLGDCVRDMVILGLLQQVGGYSRTKKGMCQQEEWELLHGLE